MVSDMFVCLFESESRFNSNCTLIFWTNLRSLVTLRKSIVGNSIRFFWKQRNKKTSSIMEIEIDNTTDVVNLILDKMEKFGINYKISKQNNAPKTGHLPPTDIESVEKAIAEIEPKIGNTIEQVEVEYLMDLYSKVPIYFNLNKRQ